MNTHGLSIWSIDSDLTGDIIGATFSNKIPKIIDTRSLRSQGELKGHSDHVRKISISPDAQICVTGSSDKSVKVWDLRMMKSF